MAVYGIDLGTTFCSVAYVERGQPRLVTLEGGGPTLASLVLLTSRGGPRAVVGSRAPSAYRELVGEAERAPGDVVLVRGSKNHMGVGSSVYAGPPWRLGERELYSTDIAAVILRTLAEMVRARPALPPLDGVVVSHPQRFRNREKLATGQAAKMAGLPLWGMITEPDAAGWAYGLQSRAVGAQGTSQTFMVFDFGGGTLDVTILRREGGPGVAQLHAIDSYGVQLGGLAIDQRIRDSLVTQYAERASDHAFSLAAVNESTRERLLELAEWFKISLNTDAGTDPSPLSRSRRRKFTPVFDQDTEGEEVTLELTLAELSRSIGGELDRAMACAEEALSRASLDWSSLDEVLLTGGSSLLWPLQQRMRERCPRVRIHDDPGHPLNPLTIVASGAAIHGAALAEGGARVGVALSGVVPDTFSVRAWEPSPESPGGRRAVLIPLVPAGTATPFVGRRTFSVRGGSSVLPVEVFEGRSEREATRVGEYRMTFPQPMPDGARAEVRLDVRSNGVLVLSVVDAATGTIQEARLDDAPGLYSDEVLAARASWLQSLRVDWNG
ncbi:MAG: Hsp70 family protein [Deltaproteobacteria bacterium]|nr:Hsp70 family protein [Deltaproteobacteria bacterium]